jgi:hypothetical protein
VEESPFGLLGSAGNAAIVSLLERRNGGVSRGLAGWTQGRVPAPTVQRYSISKRGKEEHTGVVGRPGYGKEGPVVGGITIRTDEELISDDKKTTVPNVIALEYSGALTADSIWVQFVWFELTAETHRGHEVITGDGPTPSGPRPFSNSAAPKWWVDTTPGGNPSYEAGGAHVRDASSVTMFDKPGDTTTGSPFSLKPDASSMTLTSHFDTYLIQKNQAAYRVLWTATAGYKPGPGDPTASLPIQAKIDYHVLKGEPVIGLPGPFITILRKDFPKFSKIH